MMRSELLVGEEERDAVKELSRSVYYVRKAFIPARPARLFVTLRVLDLHIASFERWSLSSRQPL